MKTFYVAPSTAVAQSPPRGHWHAMTCPGTPALSLVVVESWADNSADDEWEALSGVRPLHIEDWGQLCPPAAVTALGPLGIVPTDTIRQAMTKLRAVWSPARP